MTATPSPRAVLLGPQRLAPIVDRALDHLGVTGRVAFITAGWQEREAEDDELRQVVGRPAVNLRLHARGYEVFAADTALFEANRAKQNRMRKLQELYRRRLTHVMAAAKRLQEMADEGGVAPPDLIAPQLTSAIAMVRQLDDEHARATRAERDSFVAEMRPTERSEVARHRDELAADLAGSEAVAIAGGHVVVLLNRIRLFGLEPILAGKPIVAWSAGAMTLTGRVVLFHDSPPQGRGDAEILGDGLGLLPGLVALPHARRRLLLGDPRRISLFARRFAPALCATLDENSAVAWQDGGWRAGPATSQLTEDGACVAIPATFDLPAARAEAAAP